MTDQEMASHSPSLLCMWADMSQCRDLLASTEEQDEQYKWVPHTRSLNSTYGFLRNQDLYQNLKDI